jgi:hypothetical protein
LAELAVLAGLAELEKHQLALDSPLLDAADSCRIINRGDRTRSGAV